MYVSAATGARVGAVESAWGDSWYVLVDKNENISFEPEHLSCKLIHPDSPTTRVTLTVQSAVKATCYLRAEEEQEVEERWEGQSQSHGQLQKGGISREEAQKKRGDGLELKTSFSQQEMVR